MNNPRYATRILSYGHYVVTDIVKSNLTIATAKMIGLPVNLEINPLKGPPISNVLLDDYEPPSPLQVRLVATVMAGSHSPDIYQPAAPLTFRWFTHVFDLVGVPIESGIVHPIVITTSA